MTTTDDRDFVEETYWANYCPECDTNSKGRCVHCTECAALIPDAGEDLADGAICRDCGLNGMTSKGFTEDREDPFETFCDRVGQPDPVCDCVACRRYFR